MIADALVALNPVNESSPPPLQGELIPLNPAAYLVRWREQFDDVLVYSRSPRTRAAYSSHWRHFSRLCASHGLDPLPAEVPTVIAYVLDCAGECSTSTLTARLAAISEKHSDAESNPTTHPKLKEAETLAGICGNHHAVVVRQASVPSSPARSHSSGAHRSQ